MLVTENDYGLRLYNGDTGVIVRSPTRGVVAAFQRAGSIVEISPRRIAAVDTVHAMTIHKSQGSQFDTVAVVLPEPTSPILTRELLYTAVTRAQRRVIVVGSQRERAGRGGSPDRAGHGTARTTVDLAVSTFKDGSISHLGSTERAIVGSRQASSSPMALLSSASASWAADRRGLPRPCSR